MTQTAAGNVESGARQESENGTRDATGETFASLDPRTGEVVRHHPVHDAEYVTERVREARRAQEWWAGLGFAGRRARLDAWRKLITSRLEELASVISTETGKPLDDARIELVLVVDHLNWAGHNAEKVLRRRGVAPGLIMYNQAATVEYHPYGVVGVIGPWNYPAFTPMGSIVYALAAGNSVVFKPSEFTPGVGEWLVRTFAEVVPEQPVMSLVTGFGETGSALCSAGADKVAFTGSTATGKRVMAACSETLTPVVIECGGKDAMLVAPDADLRAAAEAAVWGAMSNAGQTCIGVERVYVAESVAERFLEIVAERARTLRPGGEPSADFGPMTMPSQIDVVGEHVRDALDRGARAVVGGPDSVRPPYVGPVVLADVPEESRAVTEETFGPLIVVNRVSDVDEGVRRANSTSYGLGAAVYSRSRGAELARRLRSGMVSVNSVLSYAAIAGLPFGGVGDSGFGRIHGADGLREFARPQAVARQRVRPVLNPMSFARGRNTVKRMLQLVRRVYG